MLTGEGTRNSQLESYMSYVTTASSAGSNPMQRQDSTPFSEVDTSPASGTVSPSANDRSQLERNAILKDFLRLGPKGHEGSLWDDNYLSLIQGVFFRACIRPPCLQDEQLQRSKFQYTMTRGARYGLLLLCIALHLARDVWTPPLDAPPFSLAPALPLSLSHLLRAALAIALPSSLYAVSDYVETLHFWLSLALLTRSLLLLLLFLLNPSSELSALTMGELWPVLTTAAAAGLIEVRWWVSARRAAQRLSADSAAYAHAWDEVLQDEREQKHLARVCKLCEHYRELRPAMQCVVLGDATSKHKGAAAAEHSKPTPTVRVQSIDQLHQQSMIVQPMLRARVQWWASRSHGWFKAKHASPDEPFIKWDDEAALSDKIAWAATKTFRRSMAKAERVYQFEVARLCDVTRETIWFESLHDLETCVMNISWDRWAEIVQVKNALHPASSSHATGGFRFVKLLLRLGTPQAKELGLDGHVCEVLLVLKQLELAKLPGAHARFTDWRDHRSAQFQQRMASFASLSLSACNPLSWFGSASACNLRAQTHRTRLVKTGSRKLLEEEVARIASQEQAARQLDWRRGQRSAASTRGVERAAMLQEYAEAMKDYLWGANNGVYGMIGKRRTTIEAATHSSALAGCFRMKQPMASVLCRPLAQALVGTAGLVHLFLAMSNMAARSEIAAASDRIARFTSLQPLEAQRLPASCISSHSLLLDSDQLDALGAAAGSTPAVFEHAPAVDVSALAFPLLALGAILVSVTMICAAVLGYLKRAGKAVKVLKAVLVVHMLLRFLVILLLICGARASEALVVSSWVVSVGVWLLLVHFAPHTLLEAFVASGTITLLSTLAVRASVYGFSAGWMVLLDPVACMCIALGVGCKALVLWNEYRCEQAFQRDVQVYDTIWTELLHQDRCQSVLDKLKFCTDQIEARIAGSGGVLRQRCLEWHPSLDHEAEALDPLWWRECALWESAELFARSPATQSIDQLYAQAEVASVVMRHKLKHWAVGSKGLFLRKAAASGCERRQWARAAELLSGEEEDISWGPLKRESRAIEKAFRCYGGDVSRLLDLSRHSIVFEEPEHMLQCVELLRADPDVQVLRIKNELHPSEAGSNGYRQVLINVAIVTEETQRMGVSMHVSEIQLLPLALALAKTDDGHRRYVMRRNARGE